MRLRSIHLDEDILNFSRKVEDILIEVDAPETHNSEGGLFGRWGQKIITTFASKFLKDDEIDNEKLDN